MAHIRGKSALSLQIIQTLFRHYVCLQESRVLPLFCVIKEAEIKILQAVSVEPTIAPKHLKVIVAIELSPSLIGVAVTHQSSTGSTQKRFELCVSQCKRQFYPLYRMFSVRHTYCIGLAKKCVDLKTAQYLIGRSTIRITAEIYTHVTDIMIESAREKSNTGTQ